MGGSTSKLFDNTVSYSDFLNLIVFANNDKAITINQNNTSIMKKILIFLPASKLMRVSAGCSSACSL